MIKRILLLTIFVFTFLYVSTLSYAPGNKATEIQRKPERTADEPRLFRRIKGQEKEREQDLAREQLELRSKAESSNIQLVGVWPYGRCQASDLDKTRNIAVVGNGETIQVLDISTPSSMSKMGEVFLEEKPFDISISGNYAYVLSRYSLRVIDISTPSSPHEVGKADISGFGFGLAVDYPYVYIAAYIGGLRIFNVSAPSNPTEVGFYSPYEDPYSPEVFFAYDVVVWSNYVFVKSSARPDTDYVDQLRIIDVSNPSAPTLSGTFQLDVDLDLWAVDASDTGYAYISLFSYSIIDDEPVYTGELKIIDVASDPANPTEVGNYTEPGSAFLDVVVSGNYAYIFDWRLWGLKVINISNIAAPFSVGECDAEGYWFYSQGLVISGNYIGIAHCGDGFGLYDVSAPNNPFHLGSFDTGGAIGYYGNPIAVSGDYAYIASCTKGLQIMDISTPFDPSVTGICDRVFGWGGVAVSGDYAYGVDRDGFWIVDISSPSNPFRVGHLNYSEDWDTYDVCVSGNYACVCGTQYFSDEYRASLDIIDISNPGDLKIEGSYICSTRSSNYGGIALSGNLVYLVLRDYSTGSLRAGLKIIDISDFTNPVELGTYFSSEYGFSYEVAVRGNLAYLAGNVLRIIDVSNPSSPNEISSYPVVSYGIALSGNYAYLSFLGLELIDISDPYTPSEAGYFYNEIGDAVAVSGNYAYIPGSLYILRNTLAPGVSITSPPAWSEVRGSISIEAQASHGSGIDKVEFYVDDSFQAADTNSPYTCDWDTTSTEEGPRKIRTRAYNNIGNSSDVEIEVTVKNNMNLNISCGSGGTTDPEPGTYVHIFGSSVSVTASPDSGYRFSKWTGDVSPEHEEDNPLTITMDEDKSITANFSATSPPPTPGDEDRGGGGGCLIATAAYGSPLHPHVDILRNFRDRYLMSNKIGRVLVGLYYKYSPFIAHLISEHRTIKVAAQINLMPLIIISYFIVHFGPVFTMLVFLLPILAVVYYGNWLYPDTRY